VTDERLDDVRAEAQAERAAEGGWEPADWSACLRSRRRRQLATVVGLVLLVGVVAPVLRLIVLGRPPSLSYWFWVSFTLIFVVETVYSFVSASGRVQWERETRRNVRVSHALRHHVGIGAADRALVTERAQSIDTWSKVAFVGWPLVAVVFVAGMLDDQGPTMPLVVPVVLACILLVARAVRRARRARRWLAHPLPRDERTP
jgi:hypothetical protein